MLGWGVGSSAWTTYAYVDKTSFSGYVVNLDFDQSDDVVVSGHDLIKLSLIEERYGEILNRFSNSEDNNNFWFGERPKLRVKFHS